MGRGYIDFTVATFRALGCDTQQILIGDVPAGQSETRDDAIQDILRRSHAVFVLGGDTRYLLEVVRNKGLVTTFESTIQDGKVMAGTLFTTAYGLVGMQLPVIWLYVSIALYGIVVWSVPTIMAAAVGDFLGPNRAAKAFGFITLYFGAGQIFGPALAGFIADSSGTFRSAFGMCAAATLAAVILAFFLPRTRP